MELKDLPPKMRQQALKIIAEEDARRAAAIKNAERIRREKIRAESADFDSRGEYEYYIGEVCPKIKSGEIKSCERQPVFPLFPKSEYCGIKLSSIRYTADFKVEYVDGTVEIVEIKSKFVKSKQRDYPIRRRLFIEQYAKPNGWRFTEIITADSREDIKTQRKR